MPDFGECLFQRQFAGARGVDAGLVFAARQQFGALQPGECGFGFGVRRAVVVIEAHVAAAAAQEFAAGDDEVVSVAVAVVHVAQFFPDVLQVAPLQLVVFVEGELGVNVVRVVEEDAVGVLLVASGASRILQVVFE